MKHIKTFESFKINETSVVDPKLKQNIEDKIKSLSPEEHAQLVQQLRDFQRKHNLSDKDMEDAGKVQAALTKSTLDDELGQIKEGISIQGIKSWWSRTKNKVFNFLTKFGLGGVVASIIDIAIGAEMQSHAVDTAGADQILDPNTAVVIGGIAAAVSIASIVIGHIGLKGK